MIFCLSSLRTVFASVMSWNFATAAASFGFVSGWCCFASLMKASLISFGPALYWRPRVR